ncbi:MULTISPECIES: hypothetical protein [unclassified Rhizobium]|uniref:type IV toxin-antitoxin system AbiEi family antitoxin domain-containing protein n=1 Tax=unclassified Rhizobium TaxID=2613769 RepID=UPI001FDEE315|nr:MULTISPECIES: hypothetical protein [unclassified Rhizobium]
MLVARLACGLYQLPDAELDANHSLAEIAKRVPKAVVCLASALAFHGLTDQAALHVDGLQLYCSVEHSKPDGCRNKMRLSSGHLPFNG